MYTAKSRRKKKTNIVRARTGCYTCRRRHRKCDEQKPECGACQRLGLQCDGYTPKLVFRDDTAFIKHRVTAIEDAKWRAIRQQAGERQPEHPSSSASQPLLSPNDSSPQQEVPEEISRSDGVGGLVWAETTPLDQVDLHNLPQAPNEDNDHPRNETVHPHDRVLTEQDCQAVALLTGFAASSNPLVYDDQFLTPPDTNHDMADLSWLSPTISPPSDKRDPIQDVHQLSNWYEQVVPYLPPVFGEIEDMIQEYGVVRLAVLALSSSCYASGTVEDPVTSFAYYSQALIMFAANGHFQDEGMDICAKLVTLMLFTYFELDCGTFSGSICHLIRMDQLMLQQYSLVILTDRGIRLLVAWAGLRSQHAMDVCSYRPGSYASALKDTSIEAGVSFYIQSTASMYEHLIQALEENYRASTVLLLFQTVGDDSSNPNYRRWIDLSKSSGVIEPPSSLAAFNSQSHLLGFLAQRSADLDQWESTLPWEGRPSDSFTSVHLDTRLKITPGLQVRPLLFTSPEWALNYARYAAAQLFASSSNIERCIGVRNDPDQWVLVILRVLAGLDIRQCVKHSRYRMGALNIALRVALRCTTLTALVWIENWVRRLEEYEGVKEAGLPLALVRRVLRGLISEFEGGRHVFLLFSNLDSFQEKQELSREPPRSVCFKGVVHGRMIEQYGSTTTPCSRDSLFIDVLKDI